MGKKEEAKNKADSIKKLDVAFEKVRALEFDDFKAAVVDLFKQTNDGFIEIIGWYANERDVMVKEVGKAHKTIAATREADKKVIEKNFQTLDKRLHELEGFTAIAGIKFKEALQRKRMSFEERKSLAAHVSIKWGKKEEEALNATSAL